MLKQKSRAVWTDLIKMKAQPRATKEAQFCAVFPQRSSKPLNVLLVVNLTARRRPGTYSSLVTGT
jgi:hypothetical protein